MKHLIYVLILFSLYDFTYAQQAKVSDTKEYAFFVDTRIDSANHRIVISWEPDTNAVGFYIKRKLKSDIDFGQDYYAVLTKEALSFTDSVVAEGKSYEYGLEKWCKNYSAWNYINTGWNLPLQEYRGRLLLLVDSTVYNPLKDEIARLISDMTGDGWLVKLRLAPRAEQFDSSKVQATKRIIRQEFKAHRDSLRAVFLLGRLPVAYSGNYAIDGHKPDHFGAWPADVYYVELDSTWTDNIVYSDSSDYPRQHNFPNDGKFDNSYLPSEVDLELGRVDLYDLPAFKISEIELLRNYLDKNHRYRHKVEKYEQNAVIDDKFKLYSTEGYGSAAWVNFSALFPLNAIDTASIRYHLLNNQYLFSYGCHSGGITSCYLVGYTDEFPESPPQSAFYTAFGSYFGDWDFGDNYLRAALASGDNVVGSFWFGRPCWHLHHLGMGESIGYSTKLSQNNMLTYETMSKYGNRMMHINLLGDPTLRIHLIAPPKNISFPEDIPESGIEFAWGASDDDVDGYYVYRSNSMNNKFVRLNDTIITSNYYYDQHPLLGPNIYQVRAVRKEHSQTGSYNNQSQGTFVNTVYPRNTSSKALSIYSAPNPAFTKTSVVVNSKIETEMELSIYDLEGKLINQLFSGTAQIGMNIFEYNLTDENGAKLAKGQYFLQVCSDRHEDSFIMVVE